MVRVVWTARAVANVEAARRYIARFDQSAGDRLAARLIQSGDSLAQFPDRGRPAGNGCREFSAVRPYVIRYERREDQVVILRIRHGAQLADD